MQWPLEIISSGSLLRPGWVKSVCLGSWLASSKIFSEQLVLIHHCIHNKKLFLCLNNFSCVLELSLCIFESGSFSFYSVSISPHDSTLICIKTTSHQSSLSHSSNEWVQVQFIWCHIQLGGCYLRNYDLYYEGHLSYLARVRKRMFCFWLQVITLKCFNFCLLWGFIYKWGHFPPTTPRDSSV